MVSSEMGSNLCVQPVVFQLSLKFLQITKVLTIVKTCALKLILLHILEMYV